MVARLGNANVISEKRRHMGVMSWFSRTAARGGDARSLRWHLTSHSI